MEEFIIPNSQYMHVAALCAIIWDIVIHIAQDFELLSGSRLSLANNVFILSRVSTVGQAVAFTVSSFGPASLCRSALNTGIALLVVSMCSTSLLFLFRARAVFFGSQRATVFFFALWLTVAGSCISQPFFTYIDSLPGEGCEIVTMENVCIICTVSKAFNDSLVFGLISWKILSFFAAEEGHKSCIAYFCGRKGLPRLSQVLLRTGQQYFLLTVIVNLVGTALMHARGGPSVTVSVSLLMMLIVLENAMGCKVFRDIKLDLAVRNESLSNVPMKPIQFEGVVHQSSSVDSQWSLESSSLISSLLS